MTDNTEVKNQKDLEKCPKVQPGTENTTLALEVGLPAIGGTIGFMAGSIPGAAAGTSIGLAAGAFFHSLAADEKYKADACRDRVENAFKHAGSDLKLSDVPASEALSPTRTIPNIPKTPSGLISK